MKQQSGSIGYTTFAPVSEILNDQFMQRYTVFQSLDKMIERSPFNVSTYETFIDVPKEKLDQYISSKSKFSTWDSMYEKAASDYRAKSKL